MVLGSQINEMSMKKLVAAAFTANIEKITVVGPPFSGKSRFFCKFGGPWGDPKIVKTGRAFRQHSLENSVHHIINLTIVIAVHCVIIIVIIGAIVVTVIIIAFVYLYQY